MKNNALYSNVMNFTRLVPVVLILALGVSGCKSKPKWGTVLPGRNTTVGDASLSGGPKNTGPDFGRPIPPPTGLDANPTPIPVVEGGVAVPDKARDEWDDRNWNSDTTIFAAQTVYFDFDKYNIKPGEVEKIRTVAKHLKSNAAHRVEVDGHCDERGTEEYNRALGEKRAQSIREFLAREGVDPSRVRTVSFGEDKPVDPGHNEAAWAKNRRGEFILKTPK
jgi:peptidoglycan-associated lipoprotein